MQNASVALVLSIFTQACKLRSDPMRLPGCSGSQLGFELFNAQALEVLEVSLLHHLCWCDADVVAVRAVFGEDLLNQSFFVGH